jgi:hypothetical protein
MNMRADPQDFTNAQTGDSSFLQALLRYLGAILAAPRRNKGGWEAGARSL